MSYYEIGEPRGNTQHPGSPDYDSSRADACADQAIEGDLMLKHVPSNLLRALADFCSDADDQAIRELLLPLYAEKQSPALKALHAEFSTSEAAADVAALAFEREYAE